MTSSSFRSENFSDDYQEESGILDAQSIEDQLVEAFDNLTAKSAKTRLVAFELIRKCLTQRCMIDFVINRRVTILDTINRILRRNKGPDLGYAAYLVSVICATIGQSTETDTVFGEIISQLLTLLADQTIKADLRCSCAKSIAICVYIIGVDGYFEQVMSRLYEIFSASCAKGDGTMPNPTEPTASLHSCCLQSWTLLLTAVQGSDPMVALELVEEYMDKVTELLDSSHLDVKISAGESLAVMCEIIKSHNEDISVDEFDELCDKIREVMTDTQKFKAKKDMRIQKSNFREILAMIEEGEIPQLSIKFGQERLVLESWSRRRLYEALCEVFGTGINHQLAENEVVRDIFGLGAVLIHMDLPRAKRSDNSYVNMVADKMRSKNMRRLRDKRADVII